MASYQRFERSSSKFQIQWYISICGSYIIDPVQFNRESNKNVIKFSAEMPCIHSKYLTFFCILFVQLYRNTQTIDAAPKVMSTASKMKNLDSEMTDLVSELKSGLQKDQPSKTSWDLLAVNENNIDDAILDHIDVPDTNNDSTADIKQSNVEPISTQCDKLDENCRKTSETDEASIVDKCTRKPLSEINVDINSILPHETLMPRIILDEKQGLKVTLNFTRDRPRDDVTVLVITTTNHGPQSISNYQFDASVSRVS